jgi:hypothetical protein
MSYQHKAMNLFQTIRQDSKLVEVLQSAIKIQAMLVLFSADDLAALDETIRLHSYGFDLDYQQALLNLISKAQNGDLD